VHWAEIGAELEQVVAEAVGDNFVWAFRRSEALAEEVARTFVEAGLDEVQAAEISAREMGANFGGFKSLARMDAKPASASSKVVSGMRGSYGGVLMFGMLGSLAGLGMFNPLSIGAGLLLGRKAYKEDMENRMARVRNEAKNNVRRFIDDISFIVTKESRDRLQAIHRQLRNHYRGIANQTTRSLNESLQAMLTSARLEENERNQRVAELSRQLNILNQVSAKATELAAPRPAATGPTPAQPRVTLRR
jgi:replication fork clamp-binding protein CrfC